MEAQLGAVAEVAASQDCQWPYRAAVSVSSAHIQRVLSCVPAAGIDLKAMAQSSAATGTLRISASYTMHKERQHACTCSCRRLSAMPWSLRSRMAPSRSRTMKRSRCPTRTPSPTAIAPVD